MRVLDLCAGTGSSVEAFKRAGDDIVGVELDPAHGQRLTMDVLEFAKDPSHYLDTIEPGWRPDVIWASPPCTAFSMAGSGKGRVRWEHLDNPDPYYGPRRPIAPESLLACQIVAACLEVIEMLKPRFWWLENPQGGLQTMGFMRDVPGPVTVTYCQYGESRMKPTVLWGVWPETWTPRKRCYNGNQCHESAPRGAKTGTQGIKGAMARAMIPFQLSAEIRNSIAMYDIWGGNKVMNTDPVPVSGKPIMIEKNPKKRGPGRPPAGESRPGDVVAIERLQKRMDKACQLVNDHPRTSVAAYAVAASARGVPRATVVKALDAIDAALKEARESVDAAYATPVKKDRPKSRASL